MDRLKRQTTPGSKTVSTFTFTIFCFVVAAAVIWAAVFGMEADKPKLAAAYAITAILFTSMGLFAAKNLNENVNPMDWIRQPVPCTAKAPNIGC